VTPADCAAKLATVYCPRCGSADKLKWSPTPHEVCRRGDCERLYKWVGEMNATAKGDPRPKLSESSDLARLAPKLADWYSRQKPCPCEGCDSPTDDMGGMWMEVKRRRGESEFGHDQRARQLGAKTQQRERVKSGFKGTDDTTETFMVWVLHKPFWCRRCHVQFSEREGLEAFKRFDPSASGFSPPPAGTGDEATAIADVAPGGGGEPDHKRLAAGEAAEMEPIPW
jgi:hypothetical protein